MMELEKTRKQITIFQIKIMAANQFLDSTMQGLPTDDLTQQPNQALYVTKYAMCLNAMAPVILAFLEDATAQNLQRLSETDIKPLLVSMDGAIRSIDAALQAVGVDVGLREDWLKC
jgi:hypothetical protein